MPSLRTVYKEIAICIVPVIAIGLLARVATGTFSFEQIFSGASTQSARFIGQAENIVLVSGQKRNLWLEIENTGPEAWTSEGKNTILLESSRLISDPWHTSGSTWLSQNKVKLWEDEVVVGAKGHFFFTIEADQDPGKYTARFNVVDANLKPLKGLPAIEWRIVIEEPRYGFQLVDHSAELTGPPGSQIDAWVRYRNTGNISWENFGENPLALAVVEPPETASLMVANRWIDDRRIVWLDQPKVAPGQEGTFSFTLKIPNDLKEQKLELRPVFDGITMPEIGSAYLELSAGRNKKEPSIAPLVVAEPRVYLPEDLNLAAVSVGHGDCFIVRTPSDKTLIFDTAHPSRVNAVTEALRRRGIKTIDYLFLSHPHWDHIGGAAEILDNFEVGQIYINGEGYPFDTYAELARALAGVSDRVKLVARGEVIELEEDLRLEILHPEKKLSGISEDDEAVNNNSLVTRLIFGDAAVLLPADIYQTSMEKLLASGQELSARIMVLPHHGNDGFSEAERLLLEAVNPDLVIKSSDWVEYQEQTSSELQQHLNDKKIKLLITAELGELDLALSKTGRIKFSAGSLVWK